jgi:UDP-N-acetylglucosamine:LPS N-acetylglucosamine transferase
LRVEIQSILTDPARRAGMSDAARTASQPRAASHLADALLSLATHATIPPLPSQREWGARG